MEPDCTPQFEWLSLGQLEVQDPDEKKMGRIVSLFQKQPPFSLSYLGSLPIYKGHPHIGGSPLVMEEQLQHLWYGQSWQRLEAFHLLTALRLVTA